MPFNYAMSLHGLEGFEEAKNADCANDSCGAACYRGDGHGDPLKMKWNYAVSLTYEDASTLEDLREEQDRRSRTRSGSRGACSVGAHPLTTRD